MKLTHHTKTKTKFRSIFSTFIMSSILCISDFSLVKSCLGEQYFRKFSGSFTPSSTARSTAPGPRWVLCPRPHLRLSAQCSVRYMHLSLANDSLHSSIFTNTWLGRNSKSFGRGCIVATEGAVNELWKGCRDYRWSCVGAVDHRLYRVSRGGCR